MIVVVSILLFSAEIVASVFGFALGGLNIAIGIRTKRGVGLFVPADQNDPVKLSLDKAVIRTNIYTATFFEKTVVLRKLSSANLTVATALVLALLGALVAGYFGIIAGGITAFSLQEFVTQRRRETAKESIPGPPGANDLEYPYDEVKQIQLRGNRILLYTKDGIVRIAISRKYATSIDTVLEKIIPAKIQPKSVLSGKGL